MRSRRCLLLAPFALCLAGGCEPTAPYRIGIVLDRDGMHGATIAAREVNASGGISGHPLELRVTQAGGIQAKEAIAAADSLAADPSILAVVGHTNSGATLAASQIYNARGVVQIAPTSTSPLYSQAGPFSFRLVASDHHQGPFIARHVLALSPRPRIAILFVNDEYGRPLRTRVTEELTAAGRAPIYEAPYGAGGTVADRELLVTALVQSRADVLVWLGRWQDYFPIRHALARDLPDLIVVGSDGFSGVTTRADSLDPRAKLQYVQLVDLQRPTPALSAFRLAFAQAGFGEPGAQSVLSYDAVMLLAEAFRDAGRDRLRTRDWLSNLGRREPFVGASGPITFTADGDREPQYFIEQVVPRRTAQPAPRRK